MGRNRSGKPTMSDVAAAAGCSQTTVSFVMSGAPGSGISEETRRRVAEAAVALGYVPKPGKVPERQTRGQRTESAGRPRPAPEPLWRPNASTSFTDRVVRSIAMEILSGRRPEGATLPSDPELIAEFGVSRTVLREATRVLTGKGLLEAKAGVGTKVRRRSEWHLFDPDVLIWQAEAGLDKAFIRHLGEMRLILEPEAAALAAQRRSAADVEHLVGLVAAMAAPGISAGAFAKADLDFHLAVAAIADNPFLSAVSALIEVALTASLRRSWPGDEPGGTTRSGLAHRSIADAIAAGDCEAARAAMRRVIDEGINRSLER